MIDSIMEQLNALQSHLGPNRESLDEDDAVGWDQVEAAKVDLLMLGADLDSTKKHAKDLHEAAATISGAHKTCVRAILSHKNKVCETVEDFQELMESIMQITRS